MCLLKPKGQTMKRYSKHITFQLETHPAKEADIKFVNDKRRLLHMLKQARAALPRAKPNYDSAHYTAAKVLDQELRLARRTSRSKETGEKRILISFKRRGVSCSVTAHHTRDGFRNGLLRLRDQIRDLRASRREIYESDTGAYSERANAYIRNEHGIRRQFGYWLMLQKSIKSKRVQESKKPESSMRHYGLELEFCSPLPKIDLAVMLADAGLSDYVQLKGDGSVQPKSGDYGHEICILVTPFTLQTVVPQVCRVLAAAKSYVNASCGYHVHLDMRDRDVDMAWNNLRQCQPLLYKMAPKTRKKSQYCKPVRTKSLTSARNSSNRYVGINATALRKYRTIEIRLHSSTLDPRKILNWVDLLTRIIDAPLMPKTVSSVGGLKKQVWLPAQLAGYLMERIKLFAKQHEGSDIEADAA